jgi:hypothetical protein
MENIFGENGIINSTHLVVFIVVVLVLWIIKYKVQLENQKLLTEVTELENDGLNTDLKYYKDLAIRQKIEINHLSHRIEMLRHPRHKRRKQDIADIMRNHLYNPHNKPHKQKH